MARNNFIPKAYDLLVIAIAFCIPLHQRIVPVLIALLLITWCIEGNFMTKLRNMKRNWLALLPAALYIFYLFGMLYSDNIVFGWRDLETKLSLFLFPVLLSSTADYSSRQVRKVLYWFVAGCIIGCFACFGWALYQFFLERYHVSTGLVKHAYINTDFFFGSRLSPFLHPSYFAMYLCFAMVLLVRELLLSREAGVKKKYFIFFIILLFSVLIFLLASKLGMILLVLIWLAAAGWIIVKRKKVATGLIAIVLFTAGFVMLYKFSAIVASRIDYTIAALRATEVDKASTESSTVRRLIWKQARVIIAENPIGVGTGDSKDALLAKYKEEGLTGAYEKNLNAHNQFFQTAVAIGWPGLIVLIASMVGLAVKALRTGDPDGWALAAILIFSFITEAMLETQAGVIFFSFFVVFLAYRSIGNAGKDA